MNKDLLRSENDRVSSTIILICLTVLAVGCILGISYLLEYNFYEKGDGGETARSVAVQLYSIEDVELAKDYYSCVHERENEYRVRYYKEKFSPKKSSFVFTVSNMNGDVLLDSSKDADVSFEKIFKNAEYKGKSDFYSFDEKGNAIPLQINYAVYEKDRKGEGDKYTIAFRWIEIANYLKYALAVALIIAIIVIVLLLSAVTMNAGVKDGEIVEGFAEKIPLDVWTLFLGAVIAVAWAVVNLTAAADVDMVVNNVVIMITCVAVALALTTYLTTLSVRVKMGRAYKNTLIYRVVRRFRRKTPRKIRRFFGETSVFGKIILGIAVYVLSEAALLFTTAYFGILRSDSEPIAIFKVFLVGWGLTRLILIPIFAMVALNLHYVKEEGQRLAEGFFMEDEIAHKLTISSVRAHAKNLDQIRKEINKAVEQELKSERMKNELITNVSHDIKTPLTAITSYADLLGSENVSEADREKYVGIVARNAEKLNQLMNNLLAASQISSGDVDIKLEKTSLGIVAEQTLEEYAPKLEKSGLTPKLNVPPDDVFIMGDGELLWRVLSNLFGNVCKYSARPANVIISLREKDGKAELAISNGLDKPLDVDADELLERFVRSDRSRHTEGNGLGLSIAKRLTEMMGGELKVSSEGRIFTALLSFKAVR